MIFSPALTNAQVDTNTFIPLTCLDRLSVVHSYYFQPVYTSVPNLEAFGNVINAVCPYF